MNMVRVYMQLHTAPFNCTLTYVLFFRCCVKIKYQIRIEKKNNNNRIKYWMCVQCSVRIHRPFSLQFFFSNGRAKKNVVFLNSNNLNRKKKSKNKSIFSAELFNISYLFDGKIYIKTHIHKIAHWLQWPLAKKNRVEIEWIAEKLCL